MTDILHSAIAPSDGIHVLHNYIYSNEASRIAASGFASTDVGRAAFQSDTGALWVLVSSSPIRWQRASGPMPLRPTASTAYTLTINDADAIVQTTSASAVALTVPLNASVPFAVGDTVVIQVEGAGTVTLTPATGAVHLRSKGGLLNSSGQYAVLSLTYLGTDEWAVTGDRA